ncbi:MAG: tetratricopeptide repeat protein, partial [Paenibacillaceae bacterium]|nr:tetratricopeptide repeat protein [Paenibacillaceae bacterium]
MKFFSKKNSTDKKKSKKSNVIMLPNDAHYHRQRGMAMMNNNQNEEALLCFKKALEIDPNDIETLTAIAMLLTEIERAEEALVMCNFVLDRLDDDPDQIYVLMATNYVSILQFDAAYRALELVRTTGKNKYVCADAKRMQREIEQYCEDSERDKHFFDFDRALLFFKVNDFDRAEQL